jgi:hypothetical protein
VDGRARARVASRVGAFAVLGIRIAVGATSVDVVRRI